jgi:hypothetical protein
MSSSLQTRTGSGGSLSFNRVLEITETYGAGTVHLGHSGFGYRLGPALNFGPLLFHASYEGVAYPSSGSRSAFSEPFRLIFGAGIRFGGG